MSQNKRIQQIENAADAAQAKGNGSQGESAMSAYMRRALLGQSARQPPRNKNEAWGRVFQQFAMPLIAQGIQSWKNRYDARGDFNAHAESLLGALLRGEQLSPTQRGIVDTYEKYYPDKYAAALEKYQQANPTQGNTPRPSFESLPEVEKPFSDLTGKELASFGLLR